MRQGCRLAVLKNSTAFICGGEVKDHKCNENIIVYIFSDMFRGTLFEKAKEEKLNLNMCDEDKLYFLEKKDIHVRGASVACSICGRAEFDNRFYL